MEENSTDVLSAGPPSLPFSVSPLISLSSTHSFSHRPLPPPMCPLSSVPPSFTPIPVSPFQHCPFLTLFPFPTTPSHPRFCSQHPLLLSLSLLVFPLSSNPPSLLLQPLLHLPRVFPLHLVSASRTYTAPLITHPPHPLPLLYRPPPRPLISPLPSLLIFFSTPFLSPLFLPFFFFFRTPSSLLYYSPFPG